MPVARRKAVPADLVAAPVAVDIVPAAIIAALDANHDGVIDASEIANASSALKALDKNGDGKLTQDELMPPRAEGTNSFAGALVRKVARVGPGDLVVQVGVDIARCRPVDGGTGCDP